MYIFIYIHICIYICVCVCMHSRLFKFAGVNFLHVSCSNLFVSTPIICTILNNMVKESVGRMVVLHKSGCHFLLQTYRKPQKKNYHSNDTRSNVHWPYYLITYPTANEHIRRCSYMHIYILHIRVRVWKFPNKMGYPHFIIHLNLFRSI